MKSKPLNQNQQKAGEVENLMRHMKEFGFNNKGKKLNLELRRFNKNFFESQ